MCYFVALWYFPEINSAPRHKKVAHPRCVYTVHATKEFSYFFSAKTVNFAFANNAAFQYKIIYFTTL